MCQGNSVNNIIGIPLYMEMLTQPTCSLSDTDDSEYHSLDSDMEDDFFLTSDAVDSKQPPISNIRLTIDDAQSIEEILDLYEKISLVYLLYDNPHTALQQIILLLQKATINVVGEWSCYEQKKNNNWANKLLEALTIIQNYAALKKLGFEKNDMKIRYMPFQEVSLYVNIVRKCCYRICEDFTKETRNSLLRYIERDFKTKDIAYIAEENQHYKSEYLEMYFLFLETEKYITTVNVKNLAHIFKQMDLANLCDKFESLHQRINERLSRSANYNVDRTVHGFTSSPSSSKDIEEINVFEDTMSENTHIYDVNPKCPGLLLIINNENFHTECRQEYADKLPKTCSKLENRDGSQADKIKLEDTFKRFGFDVKTKENLIHLNMLQVLRKTIEKFQHTSLFVAILSHGDQGVIYGANSIAVEVTEIQKIICDKRLSGIPKVLLLQSCQGSHCQKINDDDNYATDGPRKYIPPKTTDLLTFRATISGYSAVRHIVNGTWFIQEFCKILEKNPNDHISEICTKVIAEVSNKLWGEKCMVPIIETTFTKRLYLKALK